MKNRNFQLKEFEKLKKGTRVNLVLGGGGIRGIAHVALLERLEESGIEIAAISGSSAGAFIGALYASGMSPEKIISYFKTTPLFHYSWLSPTKPGIFDSDKYAKIMVNYVSRTFEELKIPMHIVAVNIQKGKPEYFHKGDLIKAILASCALPAVFSPVEIDGYLYSDGGVMDNFPVFPFENSFLPVIGSYVSKPPEKKKNELNSIIKVTQHTNSLLIYSSNYHKFSKTALTIDFPIGEYGTFETKKIDEIYAKAKNYLNNRIMLNGSRAKLMVPSRETFAHGIGLG